MLNLLFAILIASGPLVLGEALTRWLNLKGEAARKLTHVLGGGAAACLVLVISLDEIALIGILFTVIMSVIHKYKFVRSLYDVKRESLGEVYFPLGVTVAALLAQTPQAYAAAMLIVGFADAAASIVGGTYGRHRLIGTKSIEGSMAFYAVSLIVLVTFNNQSGTLSIIQLLTVAAGAMVAELVSPRGSDNLVVPAVIALLLRI